MISVRVYGSERTARAFTKLGLKVRDLSAAWDRIGAEVLSDAIPLTPVKSGRLVKSLRQGKTKTQAVVRAGGRGVKYAGPLNYGGTVSGFYGPHEVGPVYFLNTALEQNRDYAEDEVLDEINRLTRRVGLR